MKRLNHYIVSFCLLFVSITAFSQSQVEEEKIGDRLRMQYDFVGAAEMYNKALSNSTDSLYNIHLMDKLTMCDNGQGMLQYATNPEVWQVITVPRENFYLYYSHLKDGIWKQKSDGNIVLFDDDSNEMIFSKEEETGDYNLYMSKRLSDNLWSSPTLVGESFVSSKDEVLPILSPDGKSLYFSSQGLYGMGGFDIFVSNWDENLAAWGAPENLGFPFSSPYDDFLFSTTPDGDFALFASNRDCSADSIKIYVTKYDTTPVKTAISSIQEAQRIARLEITPIKEVKKEETQPSVSNKYAIEYLDLYKRLLAIKNEIQSLQKDQINIRESYAATTNSSLKKEQEEALLKSENKIFELQGELGSVTNSLQQAEMNCIINGVSIPKTDILIEEPKVKIDVRPIYNFRKMKLGKFPSEFVFEEPEEKVDYSFKITEEAMVVEDNTLPNGLIYQIQIFASSRKASIKQLKGLSPVFEKKAPSGNYIYTVGLFHTYNEANSKINQVKRLGFSSAYIVAFDSGKSVNIKTARSLETKRASEAKYRIVFTQYPEGIPSAILSLLRSITEKDIAKGISDEYGPIYFVAPFDSKTEVDNIVHMLTTGGAEGVIIETIK